MPFTNCIISMRKIAGYLQALGGAWKRSKCANSTEPLLRTCMYLPACCTMTCQQVKWNTMAAWLCRRSHCEWIHRKIIAFWLCLVCIYATLKPHPLISPGGVGRLGTRLGSTVHCSVRLFRSHIVCFSYITNRISIVAIRTLCMSEVAS